MFTFVFKSIKCCQLSDTDRNLFHASAPEKLKEHLNISRCTVGNSTSKTEFCETDLREYKCE